MPRAALFLWGLAALCLVLTLSAGADRSGQSPSPEPTDVAADLASADSQDVEARPATGSPPDARRRAGDGTAWGPQPGEAVRTAALRTAERQRACYGDGVTVRLGSGEDETLLRLPAAAWTQVLGDEEDAARCRAEPVPLDTVATRGVVPASLDRIAADHPLIRMDLAAERTPVPSVVHLRQGDRCTVVDRTHGTFVLTYVFACADLPAAARVPPYHARLRAEVAGWRRDGPAAASPAVVAPPL